MGCETRLPWNHFLDNWVVFSKPLLRILLLSMVAKSLLDDGMTHIYIADPDLIAWNYPNLPHT